MDSNTQEYEIIVGLDIGTSNINVVMAELIPKEKDERWEIRVVGACSVPSEGMRSGVPLNVDAAVKSVQKAIEEAELMSGQDVKEVYVGVSGLHITAMNAKGMVTVSGRDNEITVEDVDNAIEQARTINLSSDKEIIHVLPKSFTVDEETGIIDPVGMTGVRLEVEVHIIIATTSVVQNIYRTVERAGIKVADLVLESWASSFAVLSPDEQELGVAILDFGGGTTDLAVFYENSIQHIHSIKYSGHYVTKDVAVGLSTPMDKAEDLKIRHGACRLTSIDKDDFVTVPGIGGRENKQVEKKDLIKFIHARMEEIYMQINANLEKNKMKERLGAGIVLTGGSILLENSAELAEEVFGLPIKVGLPKVNSGITDHICSPEYATGVGLVEYAARQREYEARSSSSHKSNGQVKSLFRKIIQLIKEYI